jgi:two-component system cell cycle sensor histidine kinase/response regulator CckA
MTPQADTHDVGAPFLAAPRLLGEATVVRVAEGPSAAAAARPFVWNDDPLGFPDVEGLLGAVLCATPIPVLVKDLDGRYRYLNTAYVDLIGARPEELLGRTDFDLFDPAYAEVQQRVDTEVARDGVTMRVEMQAATGERRAFEATKSPFRDPSGRIVGVICVKRDVTATRELEVQLRHSQKMDAVGRLAGSVAHDFNNVLAGILGFAELLEQSFSTSDPRADDAREIVAAAERGRTVLRQLLTFSRRQEQRPTRVSLDALVDGVEPLLAQIAGPRVRLVRTGAAPGHVVIDAALLEQVVVNLVANARDATLARADTGRVPDVVVTTGTHTLAAGKTVHSGRLAPGRYAYVSVTDRGTGMSDETAARLFEPFFTTKPPGQGTGLGLSTAYGIVAQAGGGIHVATTLGEGSTFTVLLPLAD